jgi:hypothetical protein
MPPVVRPGWWLPRMSPMNRRVLRNCHRYRCTLLQAAKLPSKPRGRPGTGLPASRLRLLHGAGAVGAEWAPQGGNPGAPQSGAAGWKPRRSTKRRGRVETPAPHKAARQGGNPGAPQSGAAGWKPRRSHEAGVGRAETPAPPQSGRRRAETSVPTPIEQGAPLFRLRPLHGAGAPYGWKSPAPGPRPFR